ncbi:MAG: coproporphyrinogen dehydrogenase HemZ [Epulopiscium sp. Nuni2H_MBin003]|nr:MAG: coproporphyrinogen dehydrogenase HemZ [Epulopiscium sp. Nuni2H_MBin003]
MPWGILTGVRPTKIVRRYLEDGLTTEQIKQLLHQKYHISPEKIELILEVALKEQQVLKTNTNNELSIYIGIPFCPSKCIYCSFTSFSVQQKAPKIDAYLRALAVEIKSMQKSINKYKIRTIYIGGGTPTSLNDAQLEFLLDSINTTFDVSKIDEYTVEAGRPETITLNKLKIMKKYNVSRISINPQSMVQSTLDLIGRTHSVDDVYTAFLNAQAVGFDNINMDIIVGLPEENIQHIQYTLDCMDKLSPTNITVHTLAIKTASTLKYDQEKYNLAQSNIIKDMLEYTQDYMKCHEFKPYYLYRQKNILGNFENVGYTKEGYSCIYNIQIIEEVQTILAMGAGGASKFISNNILQRFINVKGVEEYIARIDEMIEKKKLLLE